MALFENIKLPSTPEADTVRKFIQAQFDKDFSRASEFFHENIVFNGLLYNLSGGEKVAAMYQDFTTKMLKTIRLEAVNEAGAVNRYMVLHWVTLSHATDEMVVCDLLTLSDGKISRVDNCFNVDNVPDIIKEDGKKTSD